MLTVFFTKSQASGRHLFLSSHILLVKILDMLFSYVLVFEFLNGPDADFKSLLTALSFLIVLLF